MTAAHARHTAARQQSSLLEKLHGIKFGGDASDPAKMKVRLRDLKFLLGNLAMLLENGLPLSKALSTLARERSMRRHAKMLGIIRRKVEAGTSFSSTLASFPKVFNTLTIHQVRVGERSGTIPATLRRLNEQLEKRGELRGKILKKLSYPILVMAAGTGLVVFMLTVVVPQFEGVYANSGAQLPAITRIVNATSKFLAAYGWVLLPFPPALYFATRWTRRKPALALKMDALLLRLPLIGQWLRDIAVHQFMDAFCIMLESGFVPADAIGASIDAVGNREVRQAAQELRAGIVRGERISAELDKRHDVFPPTMSQLVIMGEQTGNLAAATRGVQDYLRRQIEARLNAVLGSIEPVLTISMAAVIGCIVLAIYMPMFGMFDAMDF